MCIVEDSDILPEDFWIFNPDLVARIKRRKVELLKDGFELRNRSEIGNVSRFSR